MYDPDRAYNHHTNQAIDTSSNNRNPSIFTGKTENSREKNSVGPFYGPDNYLQAQPGTL